MLTARTPQRRSTSTWSIATGDGSRRPAGQVASSPAPTAAAASS